MKRTIAMLLALALSAMLPLSLAEDAPAIEGSLAEGETISIDLNGDGAEESVSWAVVPDDYDNGCLRLTVQPRTGEALTYTTDIIWKQAVYVLDLDGDGAEIGRAHV